MRNDDPALFLAALAWHDSKALCGHPIASQRRPAKRIASGRIFVNCDSARVASRCRSAAGKRSRHGLETADGAQASQHHQHRRALARLIHPQRKKA
jgi:hypothetical protein